MFIGRKGNARVFPRPWSHQDIILYCLQVLEEEIASLVELAKAYMASRPYKMSAPEDDSFEIDDALAADIIATSTLLGVSLTPTLVENNKQMFPEVVKVLEQADPKALELTRLG
nr:hypothetical protein [Tanacetum cinerariifolium]